MLTHKAKYALKALFALAERHSAEPVQVGVLAKSENIPHKFLEGIMADLMHAGLVTGKRGKGGGYLLARPVERISVGEVMRAIDGPLAPIACVSRTGYQRCIDCPDEDSCGVHLIMSQVRDSMVGLLDETSIDSVLHQVAEARNRPAAGLMFHI